MTSSSNNAPWWVHQSPPNSITKTPTQKLKRHFYIVKTATWRPSSEWFLLTWPVRVDGFANESGQNLHRYEEADGSAAGARTGTGSGCSSTLTSSLCWISRWMLWWLPCKTWPPVRSCRSPVKLSGLYEEISQDFRGGSRTSRPGSNDWVGWTVATCLRRYERRRNAFPHDRHSNGRGSAIPDSSWRLMARTSSLTESEVTLRPGPVSTLERSMAAELSSLSESGDIEPRAVEESTSSLSTLLLLL